jgi:hypothetical protein
MITTLQAETQIVHKTLLTRRQLLQTGAAAGVGLLTLNRWARGADDNLPPVRAITRGPKHHWFGYYDKLEFDPTNRYVLGQEVDFEHRSPTPSDSIRVGMVDLQDNDRWIELGTSSAWCWQQGCMLQWIPGTQSQVLWNDREDGQFVCRILDVKSGKKRTIPNPIYALSPDGKTAVSTDFGRLGDVRPGYGYVGVPDPYFDNLAPNRTGLYRVNLESGRQDMLYSFADLAGLGPPLPSMKGAKHKFNHLLVNTDGTRFEFLHRWKGPHGRQTRMYTCGMDGKDLRLVDGNGLTSHFIWRDPTHILAFSDQPSHGRRFYLFEDGGDSKIEVVGENKMTQDGHVTYLPNRDWILNDTYPGGDRMQNPYLYHVPTDRRISLGLFHSPPQYNGEWRCDTHPRYSRDGKMVVIDTPDPRTGRQLHLIDISQILSRTA